MITRQKLELWFAKPHLNDNGEKMDRIRAAALQMAATILAETEPSADQSAAIRKIREAMLTASEAMRTQ